MITNVTRYTEISTCHKISNAIISLYVDGSHVEGVQGVIGAIINHFPHT